MGIKTENLPGKTRFSVWLFYNGVLSDDHLSKATTFEWSQKWLSYTGLTVIVFAKNIILSIWQDSEYVSVLQAQILLFYKKKKIFYKKTLTLRQAQDILRIFNTHNLFCILNHHPLIFFPSFLVSINLWYNSFSITGNITFPCHVDCEVCVCFCISSSLFTQFLIC